MIGGSGERKVEVLRGHCEAVDRDPAGIEMTVGCKPLIRDTEADARRLWQSQMEHNRTPMANVDRDVTFWIGTPEQIAERMHGYRDLGFRTFHRRDGGALRRRDAGALDRGGETDGERSWVAESCASSATAGARGPVPGALERLPSRQPTRGNWTPLIPSSHATARPWGDIS